MKDAKICIHCGEEIGTKNNINNNNVNTIQFSETETGREFKASFTDTVGQSISDAFSMILANKIGTKNNAKLGIASGVISDDENMTEDAEAEIVNTSSTSNDNNSELKELKKIFKDDGEKVTLSETRLKASSKRDYGIRLTLIFAYYKFLLGFDTVSRKDITAIADDASINDSNYRTWLTHNNLIKVNNDGVEIKAPGKDAAKLYLAEILNPDIKDGWKVGVTKTTRKPKEKVV